MASKLRSAKRATRSSVSKYAPFYQLSYFKPHKKRQTKQRPISISLPPAIILSDLCDDDENDDDDDDSASVYSIIPEAYDEDKEETVVIDFDDAHDEWMANKKRLANGHYVYLCGKTTGNGKTCRRGCHDKLGLSSGCKLHFMWEENEQSAD